MFGSRVSPGAHRDSMQNGVRIEPGKLGVRYKQGYTEAHVFRICVLTEKLNLELMYLH